MAGNESAAVPGSGTTPADQDRVQEIMDDADASEVVLFHIKECYVYKIPPRKSSASYRADEWNINKWAWEGALRVVSQGDRCVVRLEDAVTGELFAQAPIRPSQPVPIEPVIDSSRFFVLRIEDTAGGGGSSHTAGGGRAKGGGAKGRGVDPPQHPAAVPAPPPPATRHAFIGIGFRERAQAYDFQAAVYDHVKYLNKKKEAEEMQQEFQSRPTTDYSLRQGQTLRLDIRKPVSRAAPGPGGVRLTERVPSPTTPGAVPLPRPSSQESPGGIPPLLPPAPSPFPGFARFPAMEVPAGSPLRQTSGEHDLEEHDTGAAGGGLCGAPSPARGDHAGMCGQGGPVIAAGQSGGLVEEAAELRSSSSSSSSRKAGPEKDDDFGDFQAA